MPARPQMPPMRPVCIKQYVERILIMDKKLGFEDFIAAVAAENQEFVRELHAKMTELGCKMEVKAAKSGFVVSYSLNRKTIANYVFRKKGMIARIYAAHVNQYIEALEDLPEELVQTVKAAPDCKRMIDPDSCNPKCPMGYDFLLKGERYRKCRSNAFMFPVCGGNNPFIGTLMLKEAEACRFC